jgi:acyl-CoA thioesterase-1
MIAKPVLSLLGLAAALGCSPSGIAPKPLATAAAPAASPGETTTTAAPTIVFLGTSLTAGFGLDPEQAYPALIQKKIDAAGLRYRVVNAGVSGETSAGARRRIDWILQKPVAVLVVETGANDGLRGQDLSELRDNIQAIFDRAWRQVPPPRLVLVGMEVITNYGADYVKGFHAVYVELARSNQVTFVPFLLEGVGGVPALNQADGIHPTAEGQQRLADNVWKVLRPLIESRP